MKINSVILSYILHYANRCIKNVYPSITVTEFYALKDSLLKKYGTSVGYDIQHIKGKKCYTCDGTGTYTYYSNRPPFRAYDWTGCWHCIGGWYKLPMWICLERITIGKFTFHKPLKRELCVKNPFTTDNMGFEVTSNKPIEGYIEHKDHWFGYLAILMLAYRYNFQSYPDYKKRYLRRLKWKVQRTVSHVQSFFKWKPSSTKQITISMDCPGGSIQSDNDLPF